MRFKYIKIEMDYKLSKNEKHPPSHKQYLGSTVAFNCIIRVNSIGITIIFVIFHCYGSIDGGVGEINKYSRLQLHWHSKFSVIIIVAIVDDSDKSITFYHTNEMTNYVMKVLK